MHAAMDWIAENLSASGVATVPSRERTDVLIAVVDGAAGPHVVRIEGDGSTLRLTLPARDEVLEVPMPAPDGDADELHRALTTLVRAVEDDPRPSPSLPRRPTGRA